MQFTITHRRHVLPACARHHPLGAEALAAPGADDDVRRPARRLQRVGEDALCGGRVVRALLAMRLGFARATRIAAALGQGMAFLFALVGLLAPWPMLLTTMLMFAEMPTFCRKPSMTTK